MLLGIVLPMTERFYIMSLDFTAIRVLLICGWLRLIIKSEYHSINKLTSIDKIFCFYILWTIMSYTILWQTMDAFINRLGVISYSFGTYFLVRFYVIDIDDIDRIIKYSLFLSIIIAVLVVIEMKTHLNYFSYLGGVPYHTMVRDGKLRCVGPFSHAITLGSFGAFLFPLACYMMWKKNGSKILGMFSVLSSVIIVLSSNSSGPFLSLLATIVALFMWHFRKNMRIIQWGILLSLVGLHLIMKAPVWALIDRVGVFAGSNTYHRFLLIDQCINRFNEWWLIGTKSTTHWFPYLEMFDVSNNFVRVAVDGGILALILFLLIIVLCFRNIGKMIISAKDNLNDQKLFWSLGVAMFSYTVSFMGVSLWDQTIIIWYLTIAIIASITYKNTSELQKGGFMNYE